MFSPYAISRCYSSDVAPLIVQQLRRVVNPAPPGCLYIGGIRMPWWMEYCPVRNRGAGWGRNLVENTPKLKSARLATASISGVGLPTAHAAAVKANIHPAHIIQQETTTFGFLPVFSSSASFCWVSSVLCRMLHHRHHVVGNSGRRFNQILVWVIVVRQSLCVRWRLTGYLLRLS
ncbi:hypothetical protein MJ572_19680 [Escherichia coli]|nr:hypothetical protein MJ572_19680 [Escherichia coli]